jgi:hypothetical protein
VQISLEKLNIEKRWRQNLWRSGNCSENSWPLFAAMNLSPHLLQEYSQTRSSIIYVSFRDSFDYTLFKIFHNFCPSLQLHLVLEFSDIGDSLQGFPDLKDSVLEITPLNKAIHKR